MPLGCEPCRRVVLTRGVRDGVSRLELGVACTTDLEQHALRHGPQERLVVVTPACQQNGSWTFPPTVGAFEA